MLTGPSIKLYEKIQNLFPDIKLIASGGVSSIEDVIKLNEMDVYAVVVGKAIYENKINYQITHVYTRYRLAWQPF